MFWTSIITLLKLERTIIIKAVTIGAGKLDSDIVTFSYQVAEGHPQTPYTHYPDDWRCLSNWSRDGIKTMIAKIGFTE
ncbi:MAG: hypothetical protein PHO01_00105 [Desulfotomaculaceae bacterium]|nr:hypothetical protein [Desulfotomaculaceae bacterium]